MYIVCRYICISHVDIVHYTCILVIYTYHLIIPCTLYIVHIHRVSYTTYTWIIKKNPIKYQLHSPSLINYILLLHITSSSHIAAHQFISIPFTTYIVQRTTYIVHWTMFNVQRNSYVYCSYWGILYTVHYTVYIVRCQLFNVQRTLFDVQSTSYVHCSYWGILYTVHCMVYIVQCTCTLYVVHVHRYIWYI